MKKYSTSIVSLVGMIIILSVAWKFDLWMDNLKQKALAEFSLTSSWLLPATTIELLFAGFLLSWLWFITNKDSNHLIVNIILILVGLGLIFYNSLASVSGLPLPMLLSIYPKSLSSLTYAFVAMVGLQRLVIKKPKL